MCLQGQHGDQKRPSSAGKHGHGPHHEDGARPKYATPGMTDHVTMMCFYPTNLQPPISGLAWHSSASNLHSDGAGQPRAWPCPNHPSSLCLQQPLRRLTSSMLRHSGSMSLHADCDLHGHETLLHAATLPCIPVCRPCVAA